MSLIPISELFHFEKGTLQSSKCTSGKYDFITASSEWKTHNKYTHECEALIFAAAASGSLGRTHYVNGKFVSSDLCFILTPKDPGKYPIDLQFYHIIFNEFKDDIVKNTKAGTSKEAIGLKAFGKYSLPYFDIDNQIKIKTKFLKSYSFKENLNTEQSYQFSLIKKLRQQILKDAMQGKLVPQDKNDEPASELLKKIKAEKAKSDKKEKTLSEIKPEEIPFEIPENWVWCRLGEINYIASGSTPKQEAFIEHGIPYLKMYNLKNQQIDFDYRPQYIKSEVHNGQLKRSRTEIGDVIMNIVGPPLGKLAIIPESLPEANFNQAAVLIRPILCKELNKWIFWYLNEMSEISSIITKGVAGQDNISVTQANLIKVPLPPFSEQKRIVSRIEELMTLCDKLEASVKTNQEYTQLLYQTALKEALQPKVAKICNEPEKAILAGHIINTTNNEDFGRVKFQKLLHLTEYFCKIDMGSNYIQKVAGPHDDNLIKGIESTLKRLRFYEIRQQGFQTKVNYTALGSAPELDLLFKERFKDEESRINSFLDKFKKSTWEQCEIISTMYAVWNNRIIKQQSITDDLLKQDFLNWDKNKAKYKDRLDNALIWMRDKNIIPDGWGKYIGKPIEKNPLGNKSSTEKA